MILVIFNPGLVFSVCVMMMMMTTPMTNFLSLPLLRCREKAPTFEPKKQKKYKICLYMGISFHAMLAGVAATSQQQCIVSASLTFI